MRETNRPPRRRRRPAVVVAFSCALVVLLYAVLEVAALAVFFVRDGGFGFAALHAQQAERARLSLASLEEAGEVIEIDERKRLHPYLGYVQDARLNSPLLTARIGAPVSPFGFHGFEGPVRRRGPQEVVVGILGGSVADILSRDGAAALEEELRRHPAFAEKKVELVDLALGGYKQPQQLLALAYVQSLGGEFDIVVNLDGFNEVALPTIERSVAWPPAHPFAWEVLAGRSPSPELLRAIGRVEHLERTRAALARAMQGFWRWSVTCNLLWRSGDDSLAGAAAEARVNADRARDRSRAAGRRAPPPSMEELAALWARCSVQIDQLCRARGIRYYHFLQPNQYVPGTKALTEEERREAYAEDSPYRRPAVEGYPLLSRAGAGLAREGVRFRDLSRVFASTVETVYVDTCCHVNALGSELMARAIARAILEDIGPAPVPDTPAITELRAAPLELRLDHPLARRSLRVLGQAADGRRRDVTYGGVTFTSSDESVAVVDRFGEVEARRPGRAVVTARLGGASVEVPVVVTFDAVVGLGGGHSAWPDEILRLSVKQTPTAIAFAFDGARRPRTGLLALSTDRARDPMCGGIAWVVLDSARPLPIAVGPTGGELSVPLSAELAGQCLFAQLFVREPDHPCRWSLSNGIAITVASR